MRGKKINNIVLRAFYLALGGAVGMFAASTMAHDNENILTQAINLMAQFPPMTQFPMMQSNL